MSETDNKTLPKTGEDCDTTGRYMSDCEEKILARVEVGQVFPYCGKTSTVTNTSGGGRKTKVDHEPHEAGWYLLPNTYGTGT